MNERIGELYTQALEYTNSVIPPERRYNDIYYAVASAKHAKLIVQECMDLCKKQEYDYLRSSEDQDFTPIDCADAIKEHFGIEE